MAISSYRLRKYRKSAHLSQRELCILVGIRSQGVMSQIEAGLKRPGVAVAMACEIVFDRQGSDLFANLRAQIARKVLVRARRLHAGMTSGGKQATAAAHLATLIARLTHSSPQL